jgi:hypothetical protein
LKALIFLLPPELSMLFKAPALGIIQHRFLTAERQQLGDFSHA